MPTNQKRTVESRRLDLHEDLCKILGSRNVYYDPPENIKIKYPAIVYSRANIDTTKADNANYLTTVVYNATYIRKDDNDDILEQIIDRPYTQMGTHFVASNMHHDPFTIYI